MLRNRGRTIRQWREAMWAWRQTGDFSRLAEAASRMEPAFRRVFLDSILPAQLRHDLESVLRDQGHALAGQGTPAR